MNSTRKPGSDFESTPGSRAKWVFIAFAAIAGYFLIAEHKAHLYELVPYWPYLLLLACPLLHIFMHGGHGGHGRHHEGTGGHSEGERK